MILIDQKEAEKARSIRRRVLYVRVANMSTSKKIQSKYKKRRLISCKNDGYRVNGYKTENMHREENVSYLISRLHAAGKSRIQS